MVRDIYCPKCKSNGRFKKIARVDDSTVGKIYLWCKCCHEEIEINLIREPRRANYNK